MPEVKKTRRWTPVDRELKGQEPWRGFQDIEEDIVVGLAGEVTLCPVPMIIKPYAKGGSSSRLRHRRRRKLLVWTLANELLGAANALNNGLRHRTTNRGLGGNSEHYVAAIASVHARALCNASRMVAGRRGPVPTGVRCLRG